MLNGIAAREHASSGSIMPGQGPAPEPPERLELRTHLRPGSPGCRRALLEADVSLPVVRRFVKKVEEAALGERVVKGLSPDQKLVKVGRPLPAPSSCLLHCLYWLLTPQHLCFFSSRRWSKPSKRAPLCPPPPKKTAAPGCVRGAAVADGRPAGGAGGAQVRAVSHPHGRPAGARDSGRAGFGWEARGGAGINRAPSTWLKTSWRAIVHKGMPCHGAAVWHGCSKSQTA